MLLSSNLGLGARRPLCPRSPACTHVNTKRVSFVADRLRTRRIRCKPADSIPPQGDSGNPESSGNKSITPDNDSSSTPSTSYYQLPWDEDEPKQLPPNYAAIKDSVHQMDNNQLQTALGVAIAAEDYALATQIKDRLQQKLSTSGSAVVSQPMDWRALGVPEWLADRAERLGFMFPTEVQRRAAPVILSGADTIIASETGSGKTAAFLVPALSQLDYPPDLFPEDLEGPQMLLLVPSFELGVQACMLLFKLWGGNISSRNPGDPANMFSYTGPPGIKVRGVLNDEELRMAVSGGRYLRGVHAVVATPDMALALISLKDSPLSFQDLRVVIADEMDALLQAYPASFGQIMDAAVSRHTPDSSSSSSEPADGQDPAAAAAADLARDRISKVKALIDRQQQQQQQQKGDSPEGAAAGGSSSSSKESLAAALAAARLEGLMAAPAAAGTEEQQQQQQSTQQQQGVSSNPAAAASADSDSSSSSSDLAAAAAAAAAGVNLDDDTPMAKPQVVLVGATVSDQDVQLALDRGWIDEPVLVRVSEAGSVPAGLKHRAIVVSSPEKRLGGLVISLRKDLAIALAAADAAAAIDAAAHPPGGGHHPAPVRVMIFAPSEAEARAAAEPLRSALWGDHMLSVLLPSTGAEPIKALHAFRDRVASMLLATPSAARGLDLPAVSHVYSLGLPLDSTEYVHKAGRAGRIGSTSGGDVCTVITREELQKFREMLEGELGLDVEVVELDQKEKGLGLLGADWAAARAELLADLETEESQQVAGQQEKKGDSEQQLETARKGLEDLFNLL